MSNNIYKKLKKQNGEHFARALRNHHNGLLEIEGLPDIVRHAGRNGEALLPYLMSLLAVDNNEPRPEPEDPFVLLDRAGYDAFTADTLEKQNSIERYFAPAELLCTFNDSARYENFHIVHAIKKNVDEIHRSDFNGHEKRQDEYGTSVISIQMLKDGGFISIKNRYNHIVPGCDNTFNSNPDQIIEGLSAPLKEHFNVDFSVTTSLLPDGYVVMGNQVVKYHTEQNNIYYGDQVYAHNGKVIPVDRGAGNAMFDRFLFDNKTKTLQKIDPAMEDSFADDFNGAYGGHKALCVNKEGNLTLNGELLIGAENSRIKRLNLPALTSMGHFCLSEANALMEFNAPALTSMGINCLYKVRALTKFNAPALTSMGQECIYNAHALTEFNAPALTSMDSDCLYNAFALTELNAPALTSMGYLCLYNADALTEFNAPALISMRNQCLYNAEALTNFYAPALTSKGNDCLKNSHHLKPQQHSPVYDLR